MEVIARNGNAIYQAPRKILARKKGRRDDEISRVTTNRSIKVDGGREDGKKREKKRKRRTDNGNLSEDSRVGDNCRFMHARYRMEWIVDRSIRPSARERFG